MTYACIMLIHVQICLLSDFITSGNIELLFRSHNAIYRVSQEEWIKLRESVTDNGMDKTSGECYRYNPKHLYPKLNGYGDLRFIYEEDNQFVSVRLGRQGAFKSSALWCVRAGKGLKLVGHQCGYHVNRSTIDHTFTIRQTRRKSIEYTST